SRACLRREVSDKPTAGGGTLGIPSPTYFWMGVSNKARWGPWSSGGGVGQGQADPSAAPTLALRAWRKKRNRATSKRERPRTPLGARARARQARMSKRQRSLRRERRARAATRTDPNAGNAPALPPRAQLLRHARSAVWQLLFYPPPAVLAEPRRAVREVLFGRPVEPLTPDRGVHPEALSKKLIEVQLA